MDVIDDRRLSTSTMRLQTFVQGHFDPSGNGTVPAGSNVLATPKSRQTTGRRHQHVSGCGARQDPDAIGDRTLTAE